MDDPAARGLDLHRGLRQRLESLQRAGVESFPRGQRPVAALASPATADGPLAPAPQLAPAAGVELRAMPSASDPHASDSGRVPTPAHSVSPIAAGTTDPPLSSETEDAMPPKKKPIGETPRPAKLSLAAKQQQLAGLCEQVKSCRLCPELAANRTQTVFGVGNPNTRLCFFGEAPGADEDRLGEPFVGRAGQLLDKIIEACTLRRRDVYILNTVKCRPPGNRNPEPFEIANCRPYFEQQLEWVRPEFICCLGLVSATALLDTKLSIGKLRGRLHPWRWAKVLVTYHPAYLLRNPNAKKDVWEDMKFLMREMGIEL